ncbi:uncharacterized protein LOC144792652 isoform X2 [Lissotriton helveticus]
MPLYCSAVNCKNQYQAAGKDGGGRPFTFHKFPKDPERRKVWVAAMCRTTKSGLPWSPTSHSTLCSAHFREEAFDRTGQTVRLRQEAVPTIFSFPQHPQQKKKPRKMALVPQEETLQDTESFDSPSQTERAALIKEWVVVERTALSENEKPPKKPQVPLEEPSEQLESCESPPQMETQPVVKEWVLVERTPLPEHNYHCSASPGNLKMALEESRCREEILRSKLQMARREERRLQGQVSLLLTQLVEARALHEDAVSLPLELIKQHPDGYNKRQWHFAATLYSYGPKAYEYLRQTGFSLPEPNTLLSCTHEDQMESAPEDAIIPGYSDEATEKTTEEELPS